MIDWSSTFDIVFAAVTVALILFFLLSTIIVAVKGKRACNAFDVVLRILASVALIASAVMFVCAVFTKLSGDIRIYVGSPDSALIAKLYLGGQVIDLPFPQLFDILSTTVGSNVTAMLLIDSLVALMVDCLVANKKSEKQSGKKADKKAAKNQPKKSPEQLKREAELERIRRIGEQAVRKTNEAARVSSQDEKTDAPTATDTEQPAEDEQPTADWRTEAPEQPTSFVGIKDDSDDFDTFDDFDADPQEQTEQTDSFEQLTEADEFTDAPEQPQAEEQTEADTDEFDGGEEFTDETLEPEETAEPDEYVDEEQPAYDESVETDEFAETEEDEQPAYDEQPETGEFAAGEQPIATEEDIGDGYDPVYDGSAEDDYLYEQPAEQRLLQDEFDEVLSEEQTDEPIEQPTENVEPVEEPPVEEQPVEQHPNVEPDRDIYIPEMRTIVKQDAPEQPQQADADKKPRAKRSTSPKPRAARPATRRTVEQVSDDKRLPVTRRYVILDRRNAVNMFGEYLKERNQAEKDKLKSSINTIIIE